MRNIASVYLFDFKNSEFKGQIYHLLPCISEWYIKLTISAICEIRLMILTSQDFSEKLKLRKITL